MAKRINKPAVAVLTLTLMVVLTAIGVLLVRSIPTTDPTPMVNSAKDALAKQDYRAAMTYYQQAYSRSQDLQWLVEAGKAARELGEAGTAFSLWQAAIMKDPTYIEARRQYVSLWTELLELSDWRAPGDTASRVGEHAKALVEADGNDFNGRFARGISYVAQRKEKPELESEGLEDLTKALEMRPDDERVLIVLGQYYGEKKQPEQARKLYEGLIKQQPNNPMGHLMLGRFLLSQEKVSEAIASLTKAAELSKGSSSTLTALAQAHQMNKETAKADELLSRAIQSDPEAFDAHLQRSLLLLNERKAAESLQLTKEWLSRKPVFTGFKASRYRSQRMRMLLQAANASIALASPTGEGKANEEMLQQAEGYVGDAEKEIGKDAPWVLLVRADVARLRGQSIAAIKLLERADTAFQSANPDVKLRLAELYRQDGNLGAAQKALADVLRLAPKYPRGYYLQAVIAAQLGNSNSALSMLDQGLSLEPDNKDMLQLKLMLMQAGGNSKEAKIVEQKVGDSKAVSIAQKMRQAHEKLLEERYPEAEAIYREILAVDPTNPTVLRTLMQLLIQADRTADARTVLDKAKAAAGDDAKLKDLEFLLTAGLSPEEREKKILELVQAEPDEGLRNTQLFVFYVSRQKYDDAQKVVDGMEAKQVEAKQPLDDRLVRMQFALAMLQSNWERAQKYLTIASERDLDGAEGGFMRAQLAMRRAEWPKAQAELEQALARFPTYASGWVWLAETLMQGGQLDRAKDVLVNKALEINPAKGEAYKDLAYIAEQQGDQEGYRSNLEKAIQYLPQDPWVAERGMFLREQDNPDRAIEVRRKLLASSPDNTENMARLALLLEGKKNYEEAGSLLTRAAGKSPKDLQMAWTLASYWLRRGEAAKAEKVLTDLEQALEGEEKAAANLLLANFHLQQKNLEKVEQAYIVAGKLSSRPAVKAQLADFYRGVGRVQDAAGAYRQVIETTGKDSTAQAGVRRSLVELLLQSQNLTEAAKEIDAYQQALPEDSLYLLMRGTLLMLQGQTEQAVAVLTEYLQKNRSSAAGLYHRGLLYLALNRLPQAIDDLQASKSLSPEGFSFQHRLALAQALEANKQPDRAVSELKDILQAYPVQKSPQSMNVAKALAMLYQRIGRNQDFEDLSLLMMAQVPDDWSWALQYGQYGETSGSYSKAMRGYSQAVEASGGHPEAVDKLLGMEISAKQYDKAIEYVQKQLPEEARKGPAKARLAEALFHKGQPDKARPLYKEALVESASDFGLSAKVLRSIAGTFKAEEAGKMLREQIAAQPDSQSARYLLAMVLAEQGNFEQAIPVSDELMSLAKTDDEKRVLLRQRGSLLYQAGKYDAAAKAYEQQLTLQPNDADSLNNLAYIFAENLNRPSEALPYARRAVELQPRNADVLDTLGWVQYLAGEMDSALGTFTSALQLSPNNIAARYHVGMVYKKKTNLDQAKREFEHAQNLIQNDPKDPLSKMFEERVRKELTELAGVAGK